MDKSSPKLNLACCDGRNIPEVTIELVRASDGEPYMKYKLKDVIISSYSVSGSTSGDTTVPTEEVTLNYTEIEWTYSKLDRLGNIEEQTTATWNVLSPTGTP
jgi:type VI secretion system secreted protein Hcp